MFSKLNKDNKGFTIIEVLIVLAIAGLIMLIVFLAVPALQRNSRNTERRNEASRLLTSANEFVTNSNGAALVAGNMTAIHTSASVANLAVPSFGVGTTPAANDTRIVWQGRCNGPLAATGGTGRQIALQFGLEPDGTVACITM
jgi:prepilin-type N-terminal cleavage/methylation domain-containing protein